MIKAKHPLSVPIDSDSMILRGDEFFKWDDSTKRDLRYISRPTKENRFFFQRLLVEFSRVDL